MPTALATTTVTMIGLAALLADRGGADEAATAEFRDEFVLRCFMSDLNRSENPDILASLFGYERVIPAEATLRRDYRRTLGSGAVVDLSFLDAGSAPDGLGVCTLASDDMDAAAVRQSLVDWRHAEAVSGRSADGNRESIWRINEPGRTGTLVLDEAADPDGGRVSLSFRQ